MGTARSGYWDLTADLLEEEREDEPEEEAEPEPESKPKYVRPDWDTPEDREKWGRELITRPADEELAARKAAPLKKILDEKDELEGTLARGLADEAEVEARARLAYLTAREQEVRASEPFMDVSTADLQEKAEAAEERRDDARDAMETEQARGSRVNKARLRRLQREFNEASEERLRLTTEVQRRSMKRVNEEGFAARAFVHAQREVTAEDEAKLKETKSEWRRGQLTEQLAETFPSRVADRAAVIQKEMWAAAEVEVGRSMLRLPPGPSISQRQREREAEAKLEAAKAKYGS